VAPGRQVQDPAPQRVGEGRAQPLGFQPSWAVVVRFRFQAQLAVAVWAQRLWLRIFLCSLSSPRVSDVGMKGAGQCLPAAQRRHLQPTACSPYWLTVKRLRHLIPGMTPHSPYNLHLLRDAE
jgi:hypothetical protein